MAEDDAELNEFLAKEVIKEENDEDEDDQVDDDAAAEIVK